MSYAVVVRVVSYWLRVCYDDRRSRCFLSSKAVFISLCSSQAERRADHQSVLLAASSTWMLTPVVAVHFACITFKRAA
ncbi:hypothetical protein Pcinc_038566 [Petrolisthes cinctipes]|uniref:Uncharacterized protein n=1 Tax=Petrolisthes cinctipes TaxID=88211 RepID=A0AAE1BTE0_PETCI|nr:hypothetical protein Pcinc_038566 [Petrolisthes cinctipes]